MAVKNKNGLRNYVNSNQNMGLISFRKNLHTELTDKISRCLAIKTK